jgi:hypothetical protein
MRVYGHHTSWQSLKKVSEALQIPITSCELGQKQALKLPTQKLNGQVLVLKINHSKTVKELIKLKLKGIIEESSIHNIDFNLPPPSFAQNAGFYLSFTTQTIYSRDFAHDIYQIMVHQGFQYKDPIHLITALHEAISNSLMHGVFCVQATHRNTLNGIGKINKSIEKALKTPETSQKRLTLLFEERKKYFLFHLRNQGTWFSNLKEEKSSFFGKGLPIIKNSASFYSIDKSQCCLSLCFNKK